MQSTAARRDQHSTHWEMSVTGSRAGGGGRLDSIVKHHLGHFHVVRVKNLLDDWSIWLPWGCTDLAGSRGYPPPSDGINVDEEYNVRVEDVSESEVHLPRPTATAVETNTVYQGHHYSYLDVQSLRQ